MSNTQPAKPPVWFWIIAIVALLWNLVGVFSYLSFVTMSADAIAAMPEDQQALYDNIPAWAVGAFAIAVFGGVAGSALLLLRHRLAVPVFVISFIGALVQMSRLLFMTNFIEVYGARHAIMPVVIIVIAVFLIWFSMSAKGRGWIR